MYPTLIEIGDFPITTFGLMIFLSFISGAWILSIQLERRGYPRRSSWIERIQAPEMNERKIINPKVVIGKSPISIKVGYMPAPFVTPSSNAPLP